MHSQDQKLQSESKLIRDSSASNLIEVSPQVSKGMTSRVIENFNDFSKAVGLKNKKGTKNSKTNIISVSRDYNYCSKLNDSGISNDSIQVKKLNQSQMNMKINNDIQSSVDYKSPKCLRESLFSNEGECLDFVLNRIEPNFNQPGFISSTDKIILREDQNMYSQLKASQPLLGLMKLINRLDKKIDAPHTIQMGYDLEFEKLMIQLKDEYNSLFKLRNQEIISAMNLR